MEQQPAGSQPGAAIAWWGGIMLVAAALSDLASQRRAR
jgi:hypothetical protein